MAKTETPADSSNADSSSRGAQGARGAQGLGVQGLGVQGARAGKFSAKAGLPPADLFDVGTGGFGAAPSPEPARVRSLSGAGAGGEVDYGRVSARDRQAVGRPDLSKPGPVRARDRRLVDELPFVAEEDVIEEEPHGQLDHERFETQRESDLGLGRGALEQELGLDDDSGLGHGGLGHGGQPAARGGRRPELEARDFEPAHVEFRAPRPAAKLPLASLEPPSGPRLDLTPSPVPRVALAPATGSQDISLVPGPHDHLGGGHLGGQSWGSRNLPTLAAQHLIGGRQRRPAPAVTLPPPGELQREAPGASGQRRLRSGIAKDVRSSKREIVLGLMIGLGLSMLLAAIGQAYLKEERPLASTEQQPELESLTLSARPESSAVALSAVGGAAVEGFGASAPGAAVAAEGGVSRESAAPSSSAAPSGAAPDNGARNGTPSRALLAAAPEAAKLTSVPGASAATRAAPERVERRAPTLARATPERARRSLARAHGTPPRKPAATIAEQPPSFEAGKSFEPPPSGRSALSPAESAGLGLDLPL